MGITDFIKKRPKLAGILIYILGYIAAILTLPFAIIILGILVLITSVAIGLIRVINKNKKESNMGKFDDKNKPDFDKEVDDKNKPVFDDRNKSDFDEGEFDEAFNSVNRDGEKMIIL